MYPSLQSLCSFLSLKLSKTHKKHNTTRTAHITTECVSELLSLTIMMNAPPAVNHIAELEREMDDLRHRIACRKFISGRCTAATAADEADHHFSHDRSTMPLCRHVLNPKSFCRLGEQWCRFRHSVDGVRTVREMKQWQTEWERTQNALWARYQRVRQSAANIKRKEMATRRDMARKGLVVTWDETGKTSFTRFYCNTLKRWYSEQWQTADAPVLTTTQGQTVPLSLVQVAMHSLVPLQTDDGFRLMLLPGSIHVVGEHDDDSSKMITSCTILDLDTRTRRWSTRFNSANEDALQFSFESQPHHFACHVSEHNSLYVLTENSDYMLRFNLARNDWSVVTLSGGDTPTRFNSFHRQSAVLIRRSEPIISSVADDERLVMERDEIDHCLYIVVYNALDQNHQDTDSNEPTVLFALSLLTMRWFTLPNGNTRTEEVPFDRSYCTIINKCDDDIVLFGGLGFSGHHNGIFRYNLSTQEWYRVTRDTTTNFPKLRARHVPKSGEPPDGRLCHSAIYCEQESKMIISGGKGYRRELDDVWSFDFSTLKWTRCKMLLSRRISGHCMVLLPDGRTILVHGGRQTMEERADDNACMFQELTMPHVWQGFRATMAKMSRKCIWTDVEIVLK